MPENVNEPITGTDTIGGIDTITGGGGTTDEITDITGGGGGSTQQEIDDAIDDVENHIDSAISECETCCESLVTSLMSSIDNLLTTTINTQTDLTSIITSQIDSRLSTVENTLLTFTQLIETRIDFLESEINVLVASGGIAPQIDLTVEVETPDITVQSPDIAIDVDAVAESTSQADAVADAVADAIAIAVANAPPGSIVIPPIVLSPSIQVDTTLTVGDFAVNVQEGQVCVQGGGIKGEPPGKLGKPDAGGGGGGSAIGGAEDDPTSPDKPLEFVWYNRGAGWKRQAVNWSGDVVQRLFDSPSYYGYSESEFRKWSEDQSNQSGDVGGF